MKILKLSLISLLFLTGFIQATACIVERTDRYYMFKYGSDTAGNGSFRENYDESVNDFWKSYCNKEWYYDEVMMESARRKGDTPMQTYLTQLQRYENTIDRYGRDSWDYPTAAELRARRSILTDIVNICNRHHTGKYAERWTLLQMRANMIMRNYGANITLWNSIGSKFPNTALRDMMRNIYANALLNTGRKIEAWNIYAEQNDKESLIWSVRKFTNLAGINKLYKEHPDAPVLEYLLQTYVNNIQDVLDCYHDNGQYDPEDCGTFNSLYPVYAQIRPDYMSEIRSFSEVSKMIAKGGKVSNPSAWMSASALVNYYLGNIQKAKTLIDEAMEMKGTEESKKMTRRAKMLISCSSDDVNSPEFKKYMAEEMAWLDKEIATNRDQAAINARHRIVCLGLRDAYAKADDRNMTIAFQVLPYTNSMYDKDRLDANNDHSSEGFHNILKMTPDEATAYFDRLRNPGPDPLVQYLSKRLAYNDDYVNDLTGTMLLRKGEFGKALPYLDKVSQSYLNNQAIAFYVSRRDYRKPSWNGWQKLGDGAYDNKAYDLKGNVKADFCRDMLDLMRQYDNAPKAEQQALALKMAGYLYNASMRGQCWFITDYSSTNYPESIPDTDFSHPARKLLNEAALSTDPSIRCEALFGLVGSAPDRWYKDDWDYGQGDAKIPQPGSVQYKAFRELDRYTSLNRSSVPYVVSRCDVLKQFRRQTR